MTVRRERESGGGGGGGGGGGKERGGGGIFDRCFLCVYIKTTTQQNKSVH